MSPADDPLPVQAVVHDLIDGFVATGAPSISWRVRTDEPDWMQRRAEVAIRRDGREQRFDVLGPRAHRLAWPAGALRPRESAEVRVRVAGPSGTILPWSEPVRVRSAEIVDGEWSARYVSGPDEEPALIRGEFPVTRAVRAATMYVAAYGAVRVHLNGSRVGDHELAPGWTSYQWRVGADVYDVADDVRAGVNVIGVELFGGWLTEAYGFRDAARRFYEGLPRAAVQLVIQYEDGGTETICSDASWRWSVGGTRSSSLYRGEVFDARAEPRGWAAPAFDASEWMPVVVSAHGLTPVARTAPPVRVTEELAPRAVSRSPSGATILDFGQNLVGRLRLRTSARSGTEVVMRHAEVLEHGELAIRPLRNADATDVYIAAGGEAEWAPRGTFHGFRYAEVSGLDDEEAAGVRAEVLGTDLRRIGGFSTSHPLLQRFHDNVVWGARGNFLSLPTDCPQRDERLGWTGDIQVFAPTAAFLFDCDAFLVSWLRDLREEQEAAGGVVPMVVPAVIPQVPGLFAPIAAWGDAITVVPAVLAGAFGDEDVVREMYPGMVRWVELVSRHAPGGLWEDGKQFGDWLDPDAPPDQPGRAKTDADIVATAYLHRSASLTAACAARLGRHDEAAGFSALAERVRTAFLDAYVTPAGRMMSDSPTAYALAIVFGLIDPGRRQALGDRLRSLVRRSGYTISTGFVGTPIVCEALSRTGHDADAGRLLLQTENPSWLYPVTMGATTIWERWDSLLEDGSLNPGQMTSFNHYALGAVADWMHRRVGGLSPLRDAYTRFLFAPCVIDGLDDAAVWHDCPAGRIRASWVREDSRVRAALLVPPNTRAVVRLPGLADTEVGSGTHEWVFDAPAAAAVFDDDGPDRARRLDLDSPLTDVLDTPGAFRTVMDALLDWDPERARALRRTLAWTPKRPLRDPLLLVPVPVLRDIESRLAGLARRSTPSTPAQEAVR